MKVGDKVKIKTGKCAQEIGEITSDRGFGKFEVLCKDKSYVDVYCSFELEAIQTLTVGDRVKIKPSSQFFCQSSDIGTVRAVRFSGSMNVDFDDGYSDIYWFEDLELVANGSQKTKVTSNNSDEVYKREYLAYIQKQTNTECQHTNKVKTGFMTEYWVCKDCGYSWDI